MDDRHAEEIQSKITEFLRRAGAPNVASQIAVHIHERREDTIEVIERMTRKQVLFIEQDLTFMNSTGETKAYGLAS